MRVVFTGPTGLGKEEIAHAVAEEAAKKHGFNPDLNDPRTQKFIQVFSIEDEIKKTLGDLRPFLDQIYQRERQRFWNNAIGDVITKIGDSEHTILCFHNFYYRWSNFFTCIDLDLLISYQPTVFVTLINDIYDMWETVNARERQFPTNSYFHLHEILAWRSAEISSTESLAKNLYVKPERYSIAPSQISTLRRDQNYAGLSPLFGDSVPHFLFSVKHPLRTLYQLLFRRDLLPVYASFPITTPRLELQNEGNTAGQAEIDNYREQLFRSDFLTMFDPLTIDEYRMQESLSSDENITPLHPRWPVKIGPPMIEEVSLTRNPFAGYNQYQFDSFKSSVERHVETRDYKLVLQAGALAAYRPFYHGPLGNNTPSPSGPSTGVDREISFASAESKRIFAVHPLEDRRSGARIFANINFAVVPQTIDELLEVLQKVQEGDAQRLKERQGDVTTWEV